MPDRISIVNDSLKAAGNEQHNLSVLVFGSSFTTEDSNHIVAVRSFVGYGISTPLVIVCLIKYLRVLSMYLRRQSLFNKDNPLGDDWVQIEVNDVASYNSGLVSTSFWISSSHELHDVFTTKFSFRFLSYLLISSFCAYRYHVITQDLHWVSRGLISCSQYNCRAWVFCIPFRGLDAGEQQASKVNRTF